MGQKFSILVQYAFPIESEVQWWFTNAPKLSWVLVLYIKKNGIILKYFWILFLLANKHQLTYISYSYDKGNIFFFFYCFFHCVLKQKNAMLGGALTGAIMSAVSNHGKDKVVKDAITGAAVATAAEFINYLTWVKSCLIIHWFVLECN